MVEISIPEDLKERMREFPSINWFYVVQDAVEERLEKLAAFTRVSSKRRIQ